METLFVFVVLRLTPQEQMLDWPQPGGVTPGVRSTPGSVSQRGRRILEACTKRAFGPSTRFWKADVPVNISTDKPERSRRGANTLKPQRSHIPGFITSDWKDVHRQLFPANNKHLTICSRWETSIDFHPPICKITTHLKLKLRTLTPAAAT